MNNSRKERREEHGRSQAALADAVAVSRQTIHAIELLAARDVPPCGEPLAHLAAYQRAQTLLEGVLAWGTHRGGIAPETVRELGVTGAELATLQAAWWWRPLGRVVPRYRWNAIAFLPEYALFGALLLVSDGRVADTYARAFAGTHPWAERIDAVRARTPSWLWRLSHGDE